MNQVLITSGRVTRRVSWDQAVKYLWDIKRSESVSILRNSGSVEVEFNGSLILLAVLP